MKLTIELVPQALWGQSLAQKYRPQWDKLRVTAYASAGHKCEICSGTGSRTSRMNPGGLEAHEVWEYTVDGHDATQRLVRLIALCPRCHACKHMGRSQQVMPADAFRQIKEHFMTVNGITEAQYQEHTVEMRSQWESRNSLNWTQDLSEFLDTSAGRSSKVIICPRTGKPLAE